MPTDLPAFEASVVSELACPACHGDLFFEAPHLVCSGCRRAYPVVDGIPALIVERAENLIDQNSRKGLDLRGR